MAVSDWDRRELCPDGGCTGLIGPEGTCKVCGRAAPNWGDERKRGTQDVDDDDDDGAAAANDAASADPIAPSAPAALGAAGEWITRTLCSDGGCVGVIGPDGKCKVCGKPGTPASAAAARADEDDEGDDIDDDEYAEDDEGDEAYSDENDDGGDDDDEADDELAAAADELAGVASSAEVDRAKGLARAASSPGGDATGASDEDDRKLCPDGSCIGVIGADGKCKVCGKEAAA